MIHGFIRVREQKSQKKWGKAAERVFGGQQEGGLRYPPPSPIPLNGARGAGSAKSVCKILSPKGLEVKILKTKAFAGGGRPHSRRCRGVECQNFLKPRKVKCHTIAGSSCGYLLPLRLTASPANHHEKVPHEFRCPISWELAPSGAVAN